MHDSDDELPFGMEPGNSIFGPFHGPLTSDDIARIEEGMNILISHLFASSPDDLAERLEDPLEEKLDGYLGIAEMILDSPTEYGYLPLEQVELLHDCLTELLGLVTEYNHRLN